MLVEFCTCGIWGLYSWFLLKEPNSKPNKNHQNFFDHKMEKFYQIFQISNKTKIRFYSIVKHLKEQLVVEHIAEFVSKIHWKARQQQQERMNDCWNAFQQFHLEIRLKMSRRIKQARMSEPLLWQLQKFR